ncbi:hypothetical protein [Aeromicrobium sp. 179-A 4D2 NHS]|uniref:hypothetical protein n=1 Tax=Aeromicrobium sp. 179-A 4D2 NHS TaxID=3142375 RepID=UPI0039A0C0BA
MALAFALVVGFGTSWELMRSHDGHREAATVVDRHEVSPNGCVGGSRGVDPRWDVTWRSADPPQGFPVEFVERGTCDGYEVGERVEIIRVVEDGRTRVYKDVVTERRESLGLAAFTFALIVIAGLPLAWIHFSVRRWWERRRTATTTPAEGTAR